MKRFYLPAWTGLLALLPMTVFAYDPLVLPQIEKVKGVDFTVHDVERNRDIPIRVYLPPSPKPAPLILFSHGLGGSREGNTFMGQHWAGRGYAVVLLQHPGSDTSVWKGKVLREIMPAMKEAANVENLRLRVQDVPAVLDQLDIWNREAAHPLGGRLALEHVGMSGHSFGAVTTQAVSGQKFPASGQSPSEARIKAALAFSPSIPAQGDPQSAFGSVTLPWMLMTGTEDQSLIRDTTPESRQQVYPALPPGGKYELVLHGAAHSVFTDRPLPGDHGQRNPNHHHAILALSTAFWDTWLRGDTEAKAWLQGDGPRSVLEPGDRWQYK